MQNQAFPGVEGDSNVPLLPLDKITLDCEAGPFWLDYVQWLEPCAPLLLHEVAVIIDVLLWDVRGKLILLVNAHNLRAQRWL